MSNEQNTNTNEAQMENQAQETQGAVAQQQVPAQPEENKGFVAGVKETAKKAWNSKPMKFVKGATLFGLGVGAGLLVSGGISTKETNSTQAAEPVVDTTATEETVTE